ncbi:UNVERIFIED_CONTAM: hypothetical protein FKN15_038770 [Acipenser sinensis]
MCHLYYMDQPVQLPILASSVISLYFLELTDVFKPVRSGFICNDLSLSMPFIEPAHEVIPFLMLLSLIFAGPAATIMVGEGILYCCLSKRRKGVGSELNINAGGCNFNSFLRRAVRFVGVHVFGLCATALITDIIQLSTGYHTPYFLTVCKPNYTSLNTSCDENAFIVEDICSGADSVFMNAGRKSFPSQHATLAAFAAVYISMYFNATLTDSSKLLKPLLVFSFIICAIICGLTRIIQYKNHPIDVYCGFVLGGGIAVYLGLYAVGNFQPSEDSTSQHAQNREPLRSLTDLSQDTSRHLPGKNGSSSDGISSHHSESILNRNHRESSSLTNLKRASADVEIISPRSPMGKENMVTFSNTLPRANTSALEDPTRRNATIHASMDSARSKQLLSQWKNKNESRKLSLQVIETEAGHSPQRTMEMRSSSEPFRMYFNATLTDSSKLLKPLLVFSFIICAIICGLTRIIQYKNHPIDVYCGFVLGGGIAVYLGLYAVGNFQPSEDSTSQHAQNREPLRSLTDLSQDTSRHLPGKNGSSSDGISSHHSESILNRNHRESSSLTNLKRASADVEIISPRSPMGKENMVTFSNTLPRANTSALEDPTRRNATIHASMDSARSKQLLSQWKNKNESRKLSLQVIETEAGHSPQRTMEMRSSSEPFRVGVSGEHQGPIGQYLKIGPGSTPLTNNNSVITGGARVSIQSRPGSSQLVHIPEETQEHVSTSPKSSSTRSKWLKVAEKTGACRTNNQPRIMQVIAMSKQQGMLQSSPKSSDGSTVSCTGSIRYKALMDQEPTNIVRVEAHPENNRPVVQVPSNDGTGSWKWKAQEKGSIRQTYELNDLNRDSESCESIKDGYGSTERKRGNPESGSEHHHHHGITTIRVTPVEGSDAASETLSIASSRDSTLRRKANIILIPERGNSPENTRNIFYKGTSPTRAFKE